MSTTQRRVRLHRRGWIALAIAAATFGAVGTAQAAPTRQSAAVTSTSVSKSASVSAAVAKPDSDPGAPSGWTTAFSDDFNGASGTGVDSNWLYDTGTSYPGGAGNWGTGEVESETNSTTNVYQDGSGHLVIKPVDNGGAWTSGRIETQSTSFAAPAGGEMEMTASIEQPNPGNGLGYWPAFWAMGAGARGVGATNWPSIGELDIMEDVNALSQVSHTFHCGVDPGGPCNETNGISSNLLSCGGCQTGYHTYSVIVDRTNTSAEQLRFYTDGNLQFTINESQVPVATWQAAVDHGFFMILNVAIGGAYPNRICNCTTPTSATSSGAGMSVDYAAVYETTGSGGGTPPTGATGPVTSGISGKCLDDYAASNADGTKADLYSCNGTGAQNWTVASNGTLQTNGKCLDITGASTADGALIELWDCNGGGNQVWQHQANGELLNPASGKCLDDPGFSTTDGTQLDLWDCNGGSNQQWTLP